jgi:pimeloyl-ACP methyl ester carboxylesterase
MMTHHRDHYFRSADDRLTLYARDYASGRDGTPILMMHGLTRNSADFEAIADILHPNHRLIIPDQRGRGRSGYDSDPSNYTPLVYMQDMFALLGSLGIERAILMGTSMGGLIAMLMAATNPEMASALILNDIGPEVGPQGLARLQQYVGKPVNVSSWQQAATYCRQINEIALPDYSDDDWMAFARRTFVADADGMPRLAYDFAISQGVQGDDPSAAPADLWPIWNRLSEIPVLVIRGQESDILSCATMEDMMVRHGGHIHTVEIPGRGHAPMLDEPTAVSAIQSFLAGLG